MADTILTFADYADETTEFLTLPRLPRTPIHTHRRANSYAEYLAEWHERYQGQAPPAKPAGELPSAEAFVNCGRWVWQCMCGSALAVEPGEDVICVRCGLGGWRSVVFPTEKAEIETQLLSLPGHRQNAPLRQWKTVWSVDDLRARVGKADALIAEGIEFPRTLSIGGTRVWVTGEVLTAANMNQYISQVMEDLAGRNGLIEFEDSISFPDSATNPFRLPRGTTGQRPASPLEAMMRYNTTLNQVEFYDGSDWTPLPTDAATFAYLNSQGLIGTGAGQLARGDHSHTPTVGAISYAEIESAGLHVDNQQPRTGYVLNDPDTLTVATGDDVMIYGLVTFRANAGTDSIEYGINRWDGTGGYVTTSAPPGTTILSDTISVGTTEESFTFIHFDEDPGADEYSYIIWFRRANSGDHVFIPHLLATAGIVDRG